MTFFQSFTEEKSMRELKTGEKVKFMAFSVLSGEYETVDKVVCETSEGIRKGLVDAEEYGALEEGAAYIVKNKDAYGNIHHHLVYIGEMIEVLEKEA
jgi:hypothetical protein